ncbi:hypothetical protein Bbelb_442370, partial [Branchiostoma belcheri]
MRRDNLRAGVLTGDGLILQQFGRSKRPGREDGLVLQPVSGSRQAQFSLGTWAAHGTATHGKPGLGSRNSTCAPVMKGKGILRTPVISLRIFKEKGGIEGTGHVTFGSRVWCDWSCEPDEGQMQYAQPEVCEVMSAGAVLSLTVICLSLTAEAFSLPSVWKPKCPQGAVCEDGGLVAGKPGGFKPSVHRRPPTSYVDYEPFPDHFENRIETSLIQSGPVCVRFPGQPS